MTSNLLILNVAILILISFLMEQGLKKAILSKSIHVKRTYWLGLMPTYISTLVFSLLLMFPSLTSKVDVLIEFQKYSLCFHIFIILLFIAALDAERVLAKKLG